jgi:aryl-phospho-beta-D-glucosidase BglC (GH1 family)
MIHNLIISIILIFISKSNSKFTQLDFLKINNSLIKNNYGNGNCVYLRGTNIGNLFVQENWMSSTNAKDQKTINEILTNRFGKETKEKLIKYYENNYFTLQDLDKIKEIGMSVIRVPFTYMNLYDKENNEYKLKKMLLKN